MQVLIVFGSRASIYSVGTHSEGSTQKATMESQNWFQFRQESFFTTNCALNKIASCKSATINVGGGGGGLRNQHIQWGRHTDNLHYLMKLFYFLYSGCWMSVNILVSNTSAPPLILFQPKEDEK